MGRIGRPHGTRGAVVVDPHTDDPAGRFAPGSVLLLGDGTELTVLRYEATDRSPVITFQGIGGREEAATFRGRELFITVGERRQLSDHEYWPDELVGLAVIDADGAEVGLVVDVETGHSQDRLIVDTTDGPIIVPLVSALVPIVDIPGGKVVVTLPPGFSD